MADNTPKTDPAVELARRDEKEKAIRAKMAAGLTREQADASFEHQQKFAPKHAELVAQQKAARAKAEAAKK